MFPAASAVTAAVKPVQPVDQSSALRSSQPQAVETARASAGETSGANIRTETAQAVKASEQAVVTARLRDQEKSEQTNRDLPVTDAPTGPPPAFDESVLERQARLAFAPPEAAQPAEDTQAEEDTADAAPTSSPDRDDPPPTPRERAEVSFAETRTLATPREPATFDVEL